MQMAACAPMDHTVYNVFQAAVITQVRSDFFLSSASDPGTLKRISHAITQEQADLDSGRRPRPGFRNLFRRSLPIHRRR
jgi:hypothetical protein